MKFIFFHLMLLPDLYGSPYSYSFTLIYIFSKSIAIYLINFKIKRFSAIVVGGFQRNHIFDVIFVEFLP